LFGGRGRGWKSDCGRGLERVRGGGCLALPWVVLLWAPSLLGKNRVVFLRLWRLLAMAWVLLLGVSCGPGRQFLDHSLPLPSLCLLQTGSGGTEGSVELCALDARGSSPGPGMRSEG